MFDLVKTYINDQRIIQEHLARITGEELTTEEIITAAGAIREDADPIMILTGGEPLVRKDFFDIATACTSLFTRVALATNGTLIDDELARKIVDCGIQRVSISLDGAESETHDTFRGLQGSYNDALRGFDALKRAGMSMQINVTVTKHNENELEDIFNFVVEQGATSFDVSTLVPVCAGAAMNDDQRPTPDR